MKRRTFLLRLLAASTVCEGSVSALAQHAIKVRRIGYLSLRSSPGPLDQAFIAALAQLGYVEGRNLAIEYRWAADSEQRLPALAAQLAQSEVEVIVTAATPAVSAALRATRTIPIVMQSAADPVASGFVTNLARPGGNLTGMSILTNELTAKRLQILRELVPEAQRTALLAIDNAFATPLLVAAMRAASQQLQLAFEERLVKTDADLPKAFASFKKVGAGSLMVQTSPFMAARRERIAELAARHRLPAMYESPSYVEAGGLVAYGPDGKELMQRSAVLVDKILNGAKPADLPIEQPTRFELALNLQAARALALNIPATLLTRADMVVR